MVAWVTRAARCAVAWHAVGLECRALWEVAEWRGTGSYALTTGSVAAALELDRGRCAVEWLSQLSVVGAELGMLCREM